MRQVQEFVVGTGGEIPKEAAPFNKDRAIFLAQMVTSEMVEFLQTVMSGDEAKLTIIQSVFKDFGDTTIPEEPVEVVADQADALIDAMYYMWDRSLRQGINLDNFFDEVHSANMRKQVDGEFIKRDDGKILKPENWIGPNMISEAEDQMNDNKL